MKFDGGTLVLGLGEAAKKFAVTLLEPPKTRCEKMGILAGSVVAVLGIRETAFAAELRASGARIVRRLSASEATIVLGVESARDLARLAIAARSLAPRGALWAVHPRGVAGVKDTDIFAAGKRAGLVAVKVARFSTTHTAEQLVIPLKDRRA